MVAAKLNRLVFDALHGGLEPVKTLQALLLLHLAVQGMVLDFKEVENARYTLRTRDRIAEDDG